ncbi:MAG TPA: 3'-5' exonuclease, partial [Herpetosiphonaceae bacterium]
RDWAAALVARPDGWAVLDTETTGTHSGAEAVDLAVIAPDGTPLFESLIRPLGRVQPGAARVHRISSAQLRQAPSFDELYPLLSEALRDRIILAYNADFDARILNFCCAQAGLPAIEAEWGCVMEAYQAYAPGQRYNLRAACASFGLAPGSHRAAPDAVAALNVLRAIAGQPPVIQAAADAAA